MSCFHPYPILSNFNQSCCPPGALWSGSTSGLWAMPLLVLVPHGSRRRQQKAMDGRRYDPTSLQKIGLAQNFSAEEPGRFEICLNAHASNIRLECESDEDAELPHPHL
ncbi:hypothetical protein DFH08DRAFT_814001 [Mycena albidolilacea]|uniref:Uncharacterized protein n=1 Tax=Mycena albidolilacea TaxID=1033008 RepID=A0AAD6ZPM2_9AGAR|nr:hypothetical protein DFH08DRAFT_814001 [Mycena albidolilacea]